MRADTAEYAREGEIPHDDFDGFPVLAFLYHLHITLHIQIGRAGHSAWCCVAFPYGEAAWDSLSVRFVSGLSVIQALIVFTRQCDWAYIHTIATGCAFIRIYVSWGFVERYPEISLLSINFFNN
jgi:hypothetical protein